MRHASAVLAGHGRTGEFRAARRGRFLRGAGLFIFIFGGITGIVNAPYNLDNVVHNMLTPELKTAKFLFGTSYSATELDAALAVAARGRSRFCCSSACSR